MNKRNFIISTGAVLMLAMLATCYAAATACRSEEVPRVTEEYRQTVLTAEYGNPFWQIGSDFASLFQTLGGHLTGQQHIS